MWDAGWFYQDLAIRKLQSYRCNLNILEYTLKKWREKIETFQGVTYLPWVWKWWKNNLCYKWDTMIHINYQKVIELYPKAGGMVQTSSWLKYDPGMKTYEVFLSLQTMKSLHFWSFIRHSSSSSGTMHNPTLKSKSRQHVLQHRISRKLLRKCLGSSGHSYAVIPISLCGIYYWGHSPVLINQIDVLKWCHKYVSEGWRILGHHTQIKFHPYLQGGSYLQPVAPFTNMV